MVVCTSRLRNTSDELSMISCTANWGTLGFSRMRPRPHGSPKPYLVRVGAVEILEHRAPRLAQPSDLVAVEPSLAPFLHTF